MNSLTGTTNEIALLRELPPVITVPEFAAVFRTNTKTVYAAILRDEIPGVIRIGRCIRIHRDAVLSWLAGNEVASRTQRSR